MIIDGSIRQERNSSGQFHMFPSGPRTDRRHDGTARAIAVRATTEPSETLSDARFARR
jgi:hypothetical protein